MKKCINCHKKFEKEDIYCRNCGVNRSNGAMHYIFIQVLSLFATLGLILSIILFIASYIVK